ncbi:MAG: sigma-70 family RNA polymerase sigma factor [Parvibaculaceae bacterium]|nr:sigma-70 family RNA polymerase sigma factor [Parvibaculaceae bacterium]
MAETTWGTLRDLLADRYGELKARLTRRFGSEELASESLHETWLRLHRQGDVGPVQNPSAYLLRVAVNIAMDRLRFENRLARRSDVKAALEMADVAPGPAQEAEARAELQAVMAAIGELSGRTRAILVASRIEGLTHQMIADRLGISRRTVLYELKHAVEHLEARIERNDTENCAFRAGESS